MKKFKIKQYFSIKDRDNYVRILYENITPGQEYNFDKFTTNIDTLGLPYDYSSIMHYEWNEFSKNGQATIVALQNGIEFPNARYKNLSSIDIEEIRRYYNCY